MAIVYQSFEHAGFNEDIWNRYNDYFIVNVNEKLYTIQKIFFYNEDGIYFELDVNKTFTDKPKNAMKFDKDISRKLKMKFDKKNFIIKGDYYDYPIYDLYIYNEKIKYLGNYLRKRTRTLYKVYELNNVRIFVKHDKNMDRITHRLLDKIGNEYSKIKWLQDNCTLNEKISNDDLENRFNKILKLNARLNKVKEDMEQSKHYNQVVEVDF